MKGAATRKPQGELRQSQVVTTFGPGSMVDLPERSVLIGGVDFWSGHDRKPVYEDRLTSRICEVLGLDGVKLYEPPAAESDPTAPHSGITSFVFPTWFLAQVEEVFETATGQRYRTRPLVPWERLVKGGFLVDERRTVPVVPVRFVQACVKGHISDIDWYTFVRQDPAQPRRGLLWLDEGGAGNDFSEIFVRCELTKKRRPLSDAAVPKGGPLGVCPGRSPWLGRGVQEACGEFSRLLTRSASNAYFSQTLSAISIPDQDQRLRDAVDRVWEDFLQSVEDPAELPRERRRQKVAVALEGFSDAAVWADIQRRKSGAHPESKSIKRAEVETLLAQPEGEGEDAPDSDFFARARSLQGLEPMLRQRIERVVLVHRLREVMAQVGFTRFEAAVPDIDGELSLEVHRAVLAQETSWLPAVENRGEGVFIAFKDEAIREWFLRPAVQARGRQLEAGFAIWNARRNETRPEPSTIPFPGLPYILLHSLSHLLITAVSLECGYAASAIRERVYAREGGYGILLYTGSPGSEGTLGGLVQVGQSIERHLLRALDHGRLCSNDPVCAQHDPAQVQEERFLHGSACHGCLLIAETCCEHRNELLDRALVVPTVLGLGAEFFRDEHD